MKTDPNIAAAQAKSMLVNTGLATESAIGPWLANTGAVQTTAGHRYSSVRIVVETLENGREVICEGRRYIVPEGDSLISVITRALVDNKLEN